jgi:NAD(P)-dependent dehydrogenase (short-subunit alcohol dehydrogenase family)
VPGIIIHGWWADRSVEHGEAAPGEIQAMGLGCDVANENSVKETFQAIKDKFGRIDVSYESYSLASAD